MKDILLVSATRKTAAEFEKSSPLSSSITKLQERSRRVTSQIVYENQEGLSAVYNRFLNPHRLDKLIVFVHDDVSIEDLFFVEKLDRAFESFDVIGLAGNQRPDPKHLSWFDPRQPLSGFVVHPNPEQTAVLDQQTLVVSSYGPTPASCSLLDGCFLAVNTENVLAAGCSFDEQFDFHFYDLDFCRSCVERNLRLGTWPLWVVHQSGGAFGSPAWNRAAEKYQSKWKA
ncbi:MAG TPA: glycosyltransferase [Pyrinomonadaceae bacterium]|nr:glycosyltransferase [Pyrinomonadaceae bacterium]